jgi:nickel superoxide dismutase
MIAVLAVLVGQPAPVAAHCQIPCGIYGDETRFTQMLEDVDTLEKSMNEITRLSGEATPNWNQLVRWVANKEEHAEKLTETVTSYFLAQRIKPVAEDGEGRAKYMHELELLHGMIVHAMKATQTTDTAHCDALRDLIGQFKASYMGEHSH